MCSKKRKKRNKILTLNVAISLFNNLMFPHRIRNHRICISSPHNQQRTLLTRIQYNKISVNYSHHSLYLIQRTHKALDHKHKHRLDQLNKYQYRMNRNRRKAQVTHWRANSLKLWMLTLKIHLLNHHKKHNLICKLQFMSKKHWSVKNRN